jgi:hypothetical protein
MEVTFEVLTAVMLEEQWEPPIRLYGITIQNTTTDRRISVIMKMVHSLKHGCTKYAFFSGVFPRDEFLILFYTC